WTHYEGVIPWLERQHERAESEYAIGKVEQYMREIPCPECNGARLKPETLAVTVGDKNIWELTSLSIADADKFVKSIDFSEHEHESSLHGMYLSARRRSAVSVMMRAPGGNWLVLKGARQNNEKDIDVRFPIDSFICITGASGSGKSSLLSDTLHPALMSKIYG